MTVLILRVWVDAVYGEKQSCHRNVAALSGPRQRRPIVTIFRIRIVSILKQGGYQFLQPEIYRKMESRYLP